MRVDKVRLLIILLSIYETLNRHIECCTETNQNDTVHTIGACTRLPTHLFHRIYKSRVCRKKVLCANLKVSRKTHFSVCIDH